MNQNIKTRITDFLEALEAAENRLPEYQDRARKINEQVKERERISEQIAELQAERVPLEAELATIKPAYMDALYEMNVSLQKKLQARKKEIEAELAKLDQAIEEKRGSWYPSTRQN